MAALKRETGNYITISRVGGEECRAFEPYPLPPKPGLEMDGVKMKRMLTGGIEAGFERKRAKKG